MTTRKEKEAINRTKLKQAFKLAKAGQYKRARFILDPIDHLPQAQKMLTMMDGKQEKRRKPKPMFTPFRVIVTLFTVVVVGGAIIASITFQSWVDNVGLLGLYGMADFEMSEEDFLYLDVVNYCYSYTNYGSDSCIDWADMVIEDHEQSVRSCFAPYRDEIFLDEQQFSSVRRCLRNAGIPNPL